MPIYEYCCEICGFEFERISNISDGEEACPRCGESSQRRVSKPAASVSALRGVCLAALSGESELHRRVSPNFISG
jgi:putative FmdB family regulatory protein